MNRLAGGVGGGVEEFNPNRLFEALLLSPVVAAVDNAFKELGLELGGSGRCDNATNARQMKLISTVASVGQQLGATMYLDNAFA